MAPTFPVLGVNEDMVVAATGSAGNIAISIDVMMIATKILDTVLLCIFISSIFNVSSVIRYGIYTLCPHYKTQKPICAQTRRKCVSMCTT